MPATTSKGTHWLWPALLLVVAVTALRVAALWFVRLDLFVDEAQYWLWGQSLDLGYYSKPPLIAWVIRGSNAALGSDSAFAIRLPGPVLHGFTALILGAIGARVAGARVAAVAVGIWLLAPVVAVGSLVAATDSVMAPFYALAIWGVLVAGERGQARIALLAGLALGVAGLGKYAALYLLPGLALAAWVSPAFRLGTRGWLALVVGFAAVMAPNVVWNLNHGLSTVAHTIDNTGWARHGVSLSPGGLAEFLAAQFIVFGPVAFPLLLLAPRRLERGSTLAGLLVLALVPLVVVSVQALLDRAYANWALAAYYPGTVVVAALTGQRGRLVTFGFGALVAVAVPVLAITAPWPEVNGKPLLARMLGRQALSEKILAEAQARGLAVYASSRDVLADLFHTGRDAEVTIYAPRPDPRAANYYEASFPLPQDRDFAVLAVLATPPACDGAPLEPVLVPDTEGGAWEGAGLALYVLEPGCKAP